MRTPRRPALDAVWYIDGRTYDASKLQNDHPGGCEAIRLGRGIDCTALFHSYHLLNKPELPPPGGFRSDGENEMSFTFDAGGFYDTVQQRARNYFIKRAAESGGMHASVVWQLLSLAAFSATCGSLYLAFIRGYIWAAPAHGILRALTVVGPGHAATHFALLPRGRWNALAFRMASPLLISNLHFWNKSHVVGHHVHTNTAMDLQVHYPLKRVRQAHGRRVFHRFQHIYMWVVYLLGMPLWTLHDVILTIASFFTGCFAGLPLTRLQRAEAAAVTAANVSINLILPFLCLEFERAVLLFMVSSVACSLTVILPNVVNHEVPEASEIASRKPMDWGVHQVVTSHNYGTNSRWSLYSSGGLNFQIEHHLFPSVHYSHYPALAEIVRTACNEYGVPYHTSRTLWQALRKHHYLLKLYAAP